MINAALQGRKLSVPVIGWSCVILHLIFAADVLFNVIGDLSTLRAGGTELLLLSTVAFISFGIATLPFIFAVGLIRRKRWGRVGTMLFCLGTIGFTAYVVFYTGELRLLQGLWAVFYFIVLMCLLSPSIRAEFVVKRDGPEAE